MKLEPLSAVRMLFNQAHGLFQFTAESNYVISMLLVCSIPSECLYYRLKLLLVLLALLLKLVDPVLKFIQFILVFNHILLTGLCAGGQDVVVVDCLILLILYLLYYAEIEVFVSNEFFQQLVSLLLVGVQEVGE